MKSRAHIKSHPIHPILVGFPIAFFTATVIFDALSKFIEGQVFDLTAFYIHALGIVFALLAAIPGIIDYAYTLPPKSSAKKRGANHGLLNTAAVILFAIAYYLKYTPTSLTIILTIEIVGLIMISIAGWMGGTLAYRNQAGVDVRYANAGKWKEITLNFDNGEREITSENELQLNQMMLIRTPSNRIVLARTETGYVAFDDRCPHKGGPLCGGSMMGGMVQCPWHGSQFDVANGDLLAGPAEVGIKTYVTTLKDGKVWVEIG